MNIKHCTEQFLRDSGLNYTIFRPCGFMQVRKPVNPSLAVILLLRLLPATVPGLG